MGIMHIYVDFTHIPCSRKIWQKIITKFGGLGDRPATGRQIKIHRTVVDRM